MNVKDLKPKPLVLSILGLFLLGGILIYCRALISFFHSDDFLFIHAVRGKGFSAVWDIPKGRFMRPFVFFGFWIDYRLWGLSPLGYHLTNILIHSLNACWTALLAYLLFQNRETSNLNARALSLLAGALFLVHPSHTEAVSWISGRSDVIATFFCLASLYGFLSYLRNRVPSVFFLSLISFACALFSKESAPTFPLVILLCELYFRWGKKPWYPRLFLGYIAVLGVYLLLRYSILGQVVGGYGSDVHLQTDVDFWLRNLIFFSERSLFPSITLNLIPFLTTYGPAIVYTFFFYIVFTIVIFILRDRQMKWISRLSCFTLPGLLILLAFSYAICLIPVINLSIYVTGSLGERLIYLPSVFAVIFLVGLIDTLCVHRRLAFYILAVIVLFYAATLHQANQIWRVAGELTRNALNDVLAMEPGNRLIVLNCPDTYRGAYIFRNGLERAVSLYSKTPPFEQVAIVTFQKILSLEDSIEIHRTGDLNFEIEAVPYPSYFVYYPIPKAFDPVFTIHRSQKRNLTFSMKNPHSGDRIMYFSEGKFERLP